MTIFSSPVFAVAWLSKIIEETLVIRSSKIQIKEKKSNFFSATFFREKSCFPLFYFRFNARVARWFVFKQKIQIWVNFGGSCNGRRWCMYFMDTWSILGLFVIFFWHLVYVGRGNSAYFFPFWYFVRRTIWQPCSTQQNFWSSNIRFEKRTENSFLFIEPW
jgi:hypothetical protein